MSEQLFSFDSDQWEKLKTKMKAEAVSRNVSFCSDFTFCQNQITYTKSTVLKDNPKQSYSKHYRQNVNFHHNYDLKIYYGMIEDHFPSYTEAVSSDFKDDSDGYGIARAYLDFFPPGTKFYDSAGRDWYGNWVYEPRYKEIEIGLYYNYSKNYYTEYSQIAECKDVTSYSQSQKYHKEVALSTHMPSVPILLGTERGHIPILSKTAKIALFSYDKDIESSADKLFKTVRYDVYIQQIKDKYGIRITGAPLLKIKSNEAENALGAGLSFDLDTTQYQDGYYRIIAVARNEPKTLEFPISGDRFKNVEKITYYMQDFPTDSVTVDGVYDGISLISGLRFAKGETQNSSNTANNKKIMSGSIYDMYSVSEVRIRQNQPAFFEAGIKNSTQSLNLVFAGLKKEDIGSEESRGSYNPESKILKVYGSEEIAGGDNYVNLRGWTKGVVASVAVTDNDPSQWLEVIGELVNKSTGEIVPGSRVIAQFPIDRSNPNAYTTVIKSGGKGVPLQGYLYWPATLFPSVIDSLKMEEYEVRLTVGEYADANKASVIFNKTYSTAAVDETGKESEDGLAFKVDIYDPKVKAVIKNNDSTSWVKSMDIEIQATDIQAEELKEGPSLRNIPDGQEYSSKLREIQIVLYDQKRKVIKKNVYSVEDKTLDQELETILKTYKFFLDEGQYGMNASLEVSVMDNVGNKTTIVAAENINIDASIAKITVDKNPKEDGKWFTDPVFPTVAITKENGKDIEKIKIIETASPAFPDLKDANWKDFEWPGRKMTYKTKTIGQETGVKYIHVYVEDGLHDPVLKTFGPYKVDLEGPEVNLSCDAIKQWKHNTTITADIEDCFDGSKLKYAKIIWYRRDGSVGGETTKSYLNNENKDIISLDLTIPENQYDEGIYAEVIASDNADNITVVKINNIYLDNTSPVVEVTPASTDYPNWLNETIDTILHVTKENGSPIKKIQIAEVKEKMETSAIPNDKWTTISVGECRKIEHSNVEIGQSSGEHYLHVKLDNGIDKDPIKYVFGPYKVDLINPEVARVDLNLSNINSNRWVEQYNRAGWYWEPVEYRVYTKDDGGSKIKKRMYQITNNANLIPLSDPHWVDMPWESDNDNELFIKVPNNGVSYIHTYLRDNAGNENSKNNRNSTAINIDLDNPVLDFTQTNIGTVKGGVLYGYVAYNLKASDATSGVKKVLYAVTEQPTPPGFEVLGNASPEKFGRTDGWVDITDLAKSADGYNFNLKAMGYSYVHVYVEDEAGRGLNTIPEKVLSQNQLDTGTTISPNIEIRPSYLIGLSVLDESGKLVIAEDSKKDGVSYSNIYALRNVSSSAMLKIDYYNYENSSTKIEIDIVDKSTGKVIKTISDLIKLDLGATVEGTAKPYISSTYWMDQDGNLLRSGLYEIRAKLYQDGYVISSVKTYVVLKQNTLVNPEITSTIAGSKTDVKIKYTEDDFLKSLETQFQSDPFIKNFIRKLMDKNPTEYTSREMSRESNGDTVIHSPIFTGKTWTFETSVTKQTTIFAVIRDAFGNEAKSSKVVYFTGNSYTPEDPSRPDAGGDLSTGGTADMPDGVRNDAVRNIETPRANNYYIGFKEANNDTLRNNIFSFLPEDSKDNDS